MMKLRELTCVVVVLAVTACTASGAYHVLIDLSSLGSPDVELEASLYDKSGVIGDSWALLDNVMLGSATDDFEGGTLGAFNGSLNPVSVVPTAGNLNGVGNYVMRINEDLISSPTIAFRDYSSPSGSVLAFDFDMTASDTVGFWGHDELVLSILDPDTLNPLCYGLTGTGDVLAMSASGLRYVDTATVTSAVIPAPGALLLGVVGVGAVGVWRRRVPRSC